MASSTTWRNVRTGAQSLLLHRARSVLTMLGVVFGVAAVIAMLSVGEGARRDALAELSKLGSRNLILHSQKAVEEGGGGMVRKRMDVYGLLYEDEARIAESFPHVVRTVPVKQVRKRAYLGARSLELLVVGTTPGWFDLVQRPLVAGRVLQEDDMRGGANPVVLTEHGARRLLANARTIGQTVRLGGAYFEVVGIVQSERSSGATQMPDSEVDAYIPLSAARERWGDMIVERTAGSRTRELVELHRLIVEVDDTANVEATAAGVRSLMEHHHPKSDYDVYVPLALLRQAESQQRIWSWTLGSIAGISLLVGGIGIMNIMLSSVTERTREIGVRRALGAKKRHIVQQFLTETVLLSGLGGLVGTGVGPALALGIETISGMSAVVPLYSVLLSVGISFTIGIVFGLYQAARAADLDPILALRHE
jgi:putative ABC transport system permease protein